MRECGESEMDVVFFQQKVSPIMHKLDHSHPMRQDEGIDSYRPTMVHGVHHGPTVVRLVFCFFMSPSLHGHRQGGAFMVSQCWLIRGSTLGQKGLKPIKYFKQTYPSVK